MTSMARLWDVGKSEPIKAALCQGATEESTEGCCQWFCGLYQSVQQFNDSLGAETFSLLIHAPKAKVPLREYQLQVGKASPTEGTLPSSVYIILKKLGAGDPKDGIV